MGGGAGGVYVNAELIAIVAAAIALGTTMLAAMRGVRQEVRALRSEMKDDVKALGSEMRGDMNALRSEIKDDVKALGSEMRGDMNALRNELKGDIKALGSELKGDMNGLGNESRGGMKALESRLRDEMQAGFKELTARIVNIGDRLSKVEGIIEGMFWGARNQPADKPGEGAA
jgi:hypothetical protein